VVRALKEQRQCDKLQQHILQVLLNLLEGRETKHIRAAFFSIDRNHRGEITKLDFEKALAPHMTSDDQVTATDLFYQIRTRMNILEPNISYKQFKMACLDSDILTREHVERAFRFLKSSPKSTHLTCQDLKQSLIRSGAIFPSTKDQTTSLKDLQQELEQQIHKTVSLDFKLKRTAHTHSKG
jgi:Ca2+-binding EF-hand superfamily protein